MNSNLTTIYFQAYLSNLIFVNYLAILEVFIDTVFMCTVTAAAILTSGIWSPKTSLNGVELCSAVFESVFGVVTDLSLLHLAKASLSIITSPLLNPTSVRALQPENALSPIANNDTGSFQSIS